MAISIWLQRPGNDSPNTPPVLITHEDTLTRCLSEGWVEVETPATPPAESEPLPATPASNEAVSRPSQRARRAKGV